MRNAVYGFFMLILLPAVVLAAEMPKPAEIDHYIKASVPIGKGSLTRLWFKGYDATLWTDADQWSMNAPYALSLRYGMDFSRDELVERSLEEMMRAASLSEDTQKEYTRQLNILFPDVHENDVITALFLPDKGVTFFYNGKTTGQITDLTFARRFMNIWLGPKTSEPELRKALLGTHGA